ncbi:hypothetical protein C4R89_02580 [Clostridioides difficile]|nr:hypothetical protein [Clostridioides difficile]MDB0438424.1 hypothetical protein [Clostridioides difficile]
MENIFGCVLNGFEEVRKNIAEESIKDLENAISEIENEVEEVKILIIKKNSDEKYINFKHDEYMKEIVNDMVIRAFKEVKAIHEEILKEI